MRNIIITGGELFNKGAQAMTFVTVSELKKRFPNHKIILLSEMDKSRPKEEKAKYAFDFMGWYPIKFARAQKNPILKLLCKLHNAEEYNECYNIYTNTDMMVDISGYALGSNWGVNSLNIYADNLEYASCFNIPYYILPQSFGPFNFSEDKKAIDERIKKFLPSVKCICAREEEGYRELKEYYKLNNILLLNDIVLNNKNVELSKIYNDFTLDNVIKLNQKSVAIIPNNKSFELSNNNDLYQYYNDIIDLLNEYGYTIYILYHSTQDIEICKKIYNDNSDKNVILLNKEFNCIEYSEIVKQVDFIVASRFHSIVHSFKENIPCIALGWAEKYKVLLGKFEQDKYNFDVRNNIDETQLSGAIKALINNLKLEKNLIEKNLKEIQKENIFDIVFGEVKK